jgi:hypothetical protein
VTEIEGAGRLDSIVKEHFKVVVANRQVATGIGVPTGLPCGPAGVNEMAVDLPAVGRSARPQPGVMGRPEQRNRPAPRGRRTICTSNIPLDAAATAPRSLDQPLPCQWIPRCFTEAAAPMGPGSPAIPGPIV